MTKKKDENLTKEEALSLAWKNRKNYKGYDRSKGSIFNSWRSITNTSKGKIIGFPDSWKDYDWRECEHTNQRAMCACGR